MTGCVPVSAYASTVSVLTWRTAIARKTTAPVPTAWSARKQALCWDRGPIQKFYLNGGLGFHSNDARGANTRVDPVTGLSTDADGNRVERADPLVRTYGAEVGLRTSWLEGLQSTLSLWWLDIDSELLFVGDAGTTEASRPSRRYGVEWANYYSPTDWLTFDADISYSKARFRGNDAVRQPYSRLHRNCQSRQARTFHDVYGGFFGGPRLALFWSAPVD